jgi:hypothetical protein
MPIPSLPRLHRRSSNRPVISLILLEIQSTTPIPWSLRSSLRSLAQIDLPFAELRLRCVDYAVPIIAAITVLPGQPLGLSDPRNSLQSPDPSFQYTTTADRAPSRGRITCLRAIFYVSLPACDPFSYCRRFVFGP